MKALWIAVLSGAAVCVPPAMAADGAHGSSGTARMLVTVEANKGTPADVKQSDITVTAGKDRLAVETWRPARHEGGTLSLWVLIDDGLDTNFGVQLDDIRAFIAQQPSSTPIGIGYIRNGMISVAQKLTADHPADAKALRLPLGSPGISASPYTALTDFIKHWPDDGSAREVLLITSGVDPYYGAGPDDPYLQAAIDEAQWAGVVVNSIYYGGAGHFGHSRWQIMWGQNYLSQLADATGGEFFWQGDFNPVALRPYLNTLSEHMDHQFLMTFDMPPHAKGFERVHVTAEMPNVTLVHQSRIYVEK